jgi:hypothetical protein
MFIQKMHIRVYSFGLKKYSNTTAMKLLTMKVNWLDADIVFFWGTSSICCSTKTPLYSETQYSSFTKMYTCREKIQRLHCNQSILWTQLPAIRTWSGEFNNAILWMIWSFASSTAWSTFRMTSILILFKILSLLMLMF